jgi:hypothetical protein
MAYKMKGLSSNKSRKCSCKGKCTCGDTPIKKVNLPKGINAEAHKDGTILVDKNLKGAKLRLAINHEKVHQKQMKRGDLRYDETNVIWKGKKYPRSKMNEGSKSLPWEKEAYNKQNKKQ